jgi:hypothetical protein
MQEWDEVDVGSGPADEACAQVGSKEYDYQTRAMAECRHFIVALKKKLGEPPEGCDLRIKSNPHDFGTYWSVAAKFDPTIQAATEYAYRCESGAPRTWEEVGMSAPRVQTGRRR